MRTLLSLFLPIVLYGCSLPVISQESIRIHWDSLGGEDGIHILLLGMGKPDDRSLGVHYYDSSKVIEFNKEDRLCYIISNQLDSDIFVLNSEGNIQIGRNGINDPIIVYGESDLMHKLQRYCFLERRKNASRENSASPSQSDLFTSKFPKDLLSAQLNEPITMSVKATLTVYICKTGKKVTISDERTITFMKIPD